MSRAVVQLQTDFRPRLLDLYCCAGGGAIGYNRAGFRVTGVDKIRQKRYPYEFHQADAITYLLANWQNFDAIHASPPCQKWTALRNMPHAKKHEDLLTPTREALQTIPLPYVIENVPGAPILNPIILCGTMFGLRTNCGAELRRHRHFETNWGLTCDLVCSHYATPDPCTISVHGHSGERSSRDHTRRTICVNETGLPLSGGRTISVVGDHPRDPSIAYNNRTITVAGSTPQRNIERNRRRESFTVEAARVAMGLPGFTMKDLSQAIPPRYTEWIGHHLLQLIEENNNASN